VGTDEISVAAGDYTVSVNSAWIAAWRGSEVLRRVREDYPAMRVLLYSGTSNQIQIVQALKLRPHGFVGKMESLETLQEALRAVANGSCYFTRFASALFSDVMADESLVLTRREEEVLQFVAQGWSSKEIASRLGIAVKTVENHRAHLRDKLHLHDIAALTRFAIRRGLVSDE
jgi:DNA-binding NarL/FixJ family response regulator